VLPHRRHYDEDAPLFFNAAAIAVAPDLGAATPARVHTISDWRSSCSHDNDCTHTFGLLLLLPWSKRDPQTEQSRHELHHEICESVNFVAVVVSMSSANLN
jgi:hypothetical protein